MKGYQKTLIGNSLIAIKRNSSQYGKRKKKRKYKWIKQSTHMEIRYMFSSTKINNVSNKLVWLRNEHGNQKSKHIMRTTFICWLCTNITFPWNSPKAIIMRWNHRNDSKYITRKFYIQNCRSLASMNDHSLPKLASSSLLSKQNNINNFTYLPSTQEISNTQGTQNVLRILKTKDEPRGEGTHVGKTRHNAYNFLIVSCIYGHSYRRILNIQHKIKFQQKLHYHLNFHCNTF